jgi:predicted DNA-binding transcriptional regulator AlpA
MKTINILSIIEVSARVGIKRSKLYLLIKAGKFPSPINPMIRNGKFSSLTNLESRSAGWIESEVESWIWETKKQINKFIKKRSNCFDVININDESG